MTGQVIDLIELQSPELQRLTSKLDALEGWLSAHDTVDEMGTEKWLHRQDVWMSTERRYRTVYDQEVRRVRREAMDDVHQKGLTL